MMRRSAELPLVRSNFLYWPRSSFWIFCAPMTKTELTPVPQERIMQIVQGFWQSRALGIAVELELADHLSEGPVHVDVLAERTGTHAPSLYRLLRALESIGVFTRPSPRAFGNNSASEC